MVDTLILYFSNTGRTQAVAEMMAEYLGADLHELKAELPYSKADLAYMNDSCRANLEQRDAEARPTYVADLPDLTAYRRLLVGHPIWWGLPPKIVQTFLEEAPLEGLDLFFFGTSGGSTYDQAQQALEAWMGHDLPQGEILSSQSTVEGYLKIPDL